MKNILFTLLLCSITYIVFSQGQPATRIYLQEVNGTDIRVVEASIERTAFLFHPEFLKAKLFSKAGKIIADQKFKLDLQESRLYYSIDNGSQMQVVSPVNRIEFEQENGQKTIFERGFPIIEKLNQNNFYEVLAEGKAWLLKDIKFIESTKIEYGAGETKSVEKLINYYGFINNTIIKISKIENILQLMADKSAEINVYLKQENIKPKKQADLEKVFKYYNSIAQ